MTSTPRHFALIPAAGVGARIGAAIPKQYVPIAGKPMLQHVLETFAAAPAIAHTFLVVSGADGHIGALLPALAHCSERLTVLYQGGASRHDTVRQGLQAMRSQVRDSDWVLVHDAARPGLTAALITQLIATLGQDPVGGLLAMRVVDTLKHAGAGDRSEGTVPRAGLWSAQTPQMFRYGLLQRAHELGGGHSDEAGAIEALGLHPRLVEGSARNFKVTLPQDFALAELFLKGSA